MLAGLAGPGLAAAVGAPSSELHKPPSAKPGGGAARPIAAPHDSESEDPNSGKAERTFSVWVDFLVSLQGYALCQALVTGLSRVPHLLLQQEDEDGAVSAQRQHPRCPLLLLVSFTARREALPGRRAQASPPLLGSACTMAPARPHTEWRHAAAAGPAHEGASWLVTWPGAPTRGLEASAGPSEPAWSGCCAHPPGRAPATLGCQPKLLSSSSGLRHGSLGNGLQSALEPACISPN